MNTAYLPLSERATLVMNIINCPTDLARIVAHFSGFDMPFKPGDTFVRRDHWYKRNGLHQDIYSLQLKPIPLIAGLGIRYFDGRTFHVYRVLRVTAHTIVTDFQKTVYVYGKPVLLWNAADNPFRSDSIQAVHVRNAENHTHKTFRTRSTDGSDLVLYNKIDMSEVVVLPHTSIVQYDVSKKQLVVKEIVNRFNF